MLLAENVVYRYPGRPEEEAVLNGVNLRLVPGEVVCLVGPNGCGKSTLARHLNGLFLPDQGRVLVDGLDPANPEHRWEVRRRVGLVGPDPDGQLVATIVEEEVAFGPANLGLSLPEIRRRVEKALSLLGISALARAAVPYLSVGQKQKVVLAAVLAMEPRYLVLDEAAAMLEPRARRDLATLIRELARQVGLGVLVITNSGEELFIADRVLVMLAGRICAELAGEELMLHREEFCRLGLGFPPEGEMVAGLIQAGYRLPRRLLAPEEVGKILCSSS